MQRGELWFAATPGGDRPVLVLTRDPAADHIGSVVVASLTRTRRDLVSELDLTAARDSVPTDCVVNFDNLHIVSRHGISPSHRHALRGTDGAGLLDPARRPWMLTARGQPSLLARLTVAACIATTAWTAVIDGDSL